MTLDTSLGQVCFSFVLNCEQGYCSQTRRTVPSRVECREESLGSTVHIQAVQINPKWDQPSNGRRRSLRMDVVNLFGCK